MNETYGLARFGPLLCYFCGREHPSTRSTWLLEPIPDAPGPGYWRLRCRKPCTGIPFVPKEVR